MLLTIILCAFLIGMDQLLKLWAVHTVAPVGSMPFIPHIIEFRYVENDGAAFSLFSGQQTLLVVFTGVVLLVGAYVLLFRRPKVKLEYIAILLAFSGGVGNWIGRLLNGFVVDYLATLFMDFPVFNLADILICVGVALFVIAIFRAEIKDKRLKKELDSSEENRGDTPASLSGTGNKDG